MEKTKNERPAEQKGAEKQKDEVVKRGEAAIAAARKVNPEPEETQKQKDEEDAEKWRNEG